MTDEQLSGQEKLAKIDLMKKRLKNASELDVPVTGSVAILLQIGEPLDDVLAEAGDIDVVDQDGTKIDQIYESGLEEVPCASDGWEGRIVKKSFDDGLKTIDLKLVSIDDVVRSMTTMWTEGRLTHIQTAHAEKLDRQIRFLARARNQITNPDTIKTIEESSDKKISWSEGKGYKISS